MIKEINKSLLLPTEMYTFTGRLLELIESTSLQEVFVQRCAYLLSNSRDTLQAILNKEVGNALTAQVAEKDKARDKAFVFLKDFIKAITQHPDEAMAEQANLLWSFFEKQGLSLHTLGYAQQSAGLNLLFQDLDREASQRALEKLNAQSFYENLKNAQLTFEEVYQQKVKSESEKPNLPTRKEEVQKIGTHTDELICVLNIILQTEDDANERNKVSALASKINEVIDGFMSVAKIRKTKSNKEEKNPF